MDKLERKSTADLPPTSEELTSGFAKVRIQRVGVHVLQVGAVEEVVELKPDLEVESFSEAVVLVNCSVCLGEIRASELVEFLVAFGSQSRLCKLRQGTGENAVEESRLGVALRVVGDVGVIQVLPVGVVVAAVRGEPVNLVAG